MFLLAGTKKGGDAQCSRVAAHGRLRRHRQRVTNGLLFRTGKGCSCPAPPPCAELAVTFCLARLAAGSREAAVKALLVRGFLQPASPLRGWGRWGQGKAHLEPQGHLAPLRALLLRSLASKECLLEGGRGQAGAMDIAELGAPGAAREPHATEFCSEPAMDEAFPALPPEPLRTTFHGAGAVCGRDPEPPPGSGPACKGVFGLLQPVLGFYMRCLIAAVPVLRGPAGGSRHVSSPLVGTPAWGAGRGSPCLQTPGLPQELSSPACAASCQAFGLGS